MKTRSIFLVGGARPNFMKIGPLHAALARRQGFAVSIVHTGQHYDPELSDVFFTELGIPRPAFSLEVGSGTQGAQTARILERFEKLVLEQKPDLVVVAGDVNSTIACGLATAKAVYPSGERPKLAHVEAGLRSFDRTMPEEVNRILTDAISDFLFTSEPSGRENLLREGVPEEKIFFVGNVMIDSLRRFMDQARPRQAWRRFGLEPKRYAVATLHRAGNVDDDAILVRIFEALRRIAAKRPIVFPVHPRTAARVAKLGLDPSGDGALRLVSPVGYLDFLSLMESADFVLTDSGGIQEESLILGIPCLTLRDNTERPITLSQGTNELVGRDPERIVGAVERILAGERSSPVVPDLWDGKAAERIAAVLDEGLG